MIVVDCSYTMALVMQDEALPTSLDRAIEARLFAPAVWPFEVANALRSVVRRGRLPESLVPDLCARIEAYDVQVPGLTDPGLREKYLSAQSHDLTAYDAAYLDMALQRRCALATLDARLAAVAARAGLEVLS